MNFARLQPTADDIQVGKSAIEARAQIAEMQDRIQAQREVVSKLGDEVTALSRSRPWERCPCPDESLKLKREFVAKADELRDAEEMLEAVKLAAENRRQQHVAAAQKVEGRIKKRFATKADEAAEKCEANLRNAIRDFYELQAALNGGLVGGASYRVELLAGNHDLTRAAQDAYGQAVKKYREAIEKKAANDN